MDTAQFLVAVSGLADGRASIAITRDEVDPSHVYAVASLEIGGGTMEVTCAFGHPGGPEWRVSVQLPNADFWIDGPIKASVGEAVRGFTAQLDRDTEMLRRAVDELAGVESGRSARQMTFDRALSVPARWKVQVQA